MESEDENMSLSWEWNDRIGTCTVEQNVHGKEPYTFNIYKGNAFAIFIYEYDNDGVGKYALTNFFADKTHAKRMLGLDSKYKETYGKKNYLDHDYERYVEFALDASRKEAKELAELLMKAEWKSGITIRMMPHEYFEKEE